ncbi:hypothetical protein PPROV_000820000 [Pycnococcus provasolii]|uniref:peptidylprolyl isomerase n=2 Tax=Pycnococcus provasolii TaxID=41880 RepID=A0A830HRY3_9CHLO|nr:hypothetical protein PPROV_000820000 [Pycnococcus provasolii]
MMMMHVTMTSHHGTKRSPSLSLVVANAPTSRRRGHASRRAVLTCRGSHTPHSNKGSLTVSRRTCFLQGCSQGFVLALGGGVLNLSLAHQARADAECESCSNSNSSLKEGDREFTLLPSGMRVLDLREGTGRTVEAGDEVVADWVGYTAGYQGKRIESTRQTDEPFVFRVGKGEAIKAFDEAVLGMKEGGLRRFEIPGELVDELAYTLNPKTRYDRGPVPVTFAGRRALDFVLDSSTLKPFNRTLLFDVRVSNIRRR